MDEARQYIDQWCATTERVVGAALVKNKVKISHPSEKNIKFNIIEKADGIVTIQIITRDALRFIDMPAGRGHKLDRQAYNKHTDKYKVRKKKNVFSRPIYGRLEALKSVLTVTTIERIMEEVEDIFDED